MLKHTPTRVQIVAHGIEEWACDVCDWRAVITLWPPRIWPEHPGYPNVDHTPDLPVLNRKDQDDG